MHKKQRMTVPFFLNVCGLFISAMAFLIALIVCVIHEASEWWWLFIPIGVFAAINGVIFYGFKGRDS